MAHINFGKHQNHPQPEQNEEADQSQMSILDESRRKFSDELDERRGDDLKQPVDEIILPGLAAENAYQALRDQEHAGYLD